MCFLRENDAIRRSIVLVLSDYIVQTSNTLIKHIYFTILDVIWYLLFLKHLNPLSSECPLLPSDMLIYFEECQNRAHTHKYTFYMHA